MTRFTAAADGPKRFGLGRHGEMTADEARQKVAVAIDRIRQGLDPEVPEPTVTDLAERYMESHVRMHCRPNTIKCFGRLVRLYIVPELGHLRLSEVDRSHVSTLHHQLQDKPAQAKYVLDVLSGMLRLAEAWGMTPPHRNPCQSVRRYRARPREWFLSPDEYRELGRVLDEAEADGSVIPTAIQATRILLLTGCRKNEILTLKWDDVDRVSGLPAIPTRRLPQARKIRDSGRGLTSPKKQYGLRSRWRRRAAAWARRYGSPGPTMR